MPERVLNCQVLSVSYSSVEILNDFLLTGCVTKLENLQVTLLKSDPAGICFAEQ